MNNKEIVKNIISKYKSHFSDVSSFYVFQDIPLRKWQNSSLSHKLMFHEEIYVLSDNTLFGSASESMLLTENGLSIFTLGDKQPLKLSWGRIEEVKFVNKKYYFYYFENNKNSISHYEFDYFNIIFNLPSDNNAIFMFVDMINEILGNIADSFKILKNQILKELDSNNYDLVLSLCCKFEDLYGEDLSLNYCKAVAYKENEVYSNALLEIDYYINELENVTNNKSDKPSIVAAYKLKASINECINDNYNAIRSYVCAKRIVDNSAEKIEIQTSITNNYSVVKDNFLALPISKRKIIYIDYEYFDLSPNLFIVLLISGLPRIKFPTGHPKVKSFYIVHPFSQDEYLPFDDFERFLFVNKIYEFRIFLQALGATKLSIEYIRGKDSGDKTSQKQDKDIEVNVVQNYGGGGISSSKEKEIKQCSLESIETVQTFSPVKKPYLPENMIWFNNEKSWQDLYQQRIEGHLNSHSETLTSKHYYSLSKNELYDIRAEYENFIVAAKGKSITENKVELNEEEVIKYKINVEFAPINKLSE